MRNILFVLFVCVSLFLGIGLLEGHGSLLIESLAALIQTYLGVSRAGAFVIIFAVFLGAVVGVYCTGSPRAD